MTLLVRGSFLKVHDGVTTATASAADITFPDGVANRVQIKAERTTGADLNMTIFKIDSAGVSTVEKVVLTNAAETTLVTDAGKTHSLEKYIDVNGYAAIRLKFDPSGNATSIWLKAH